MKYIKLFEELGVKTYNVGDYVLLSGKGWQVYKIVKIIKTGELIDAWGEAADEFVIQQLSQNKNLDADGNFRNYYIEAFRLDTNKRVAFWIDQSEIGRTPTPEEIEEFEDRKEANKYNL